MFLLQLPSKCHHTKRLPTFTKSLFDVRTSVKFSKPPTYYAFYTGCLTKNAIRASHVLLGCFRSAFQHFFLMSTSNAYTEYNSLQTIHMYEDANNIENKQIVWITKCGEDSVHKPCCYLRKLSQDEDTKAPCHWFCYSQTVENFGTVGFLESGS